MGEHAELTGRRRWVRRQCFPTALVSDVTGFESVMEMVREQMRRDLERAGLVVDPEHGEVTLSVHAVEMPRLDDGIPVIFRLDDAGHPRPLRREPCLDTPPGWAEAIELTAEVRVVPACRADSSRDGWSSWLR